MSEVKSRPQHKPCVYCEKPHNAEDFSWYRYTTIQGKGSIRRNSSCKECARQKRRDRYARNPTKDLASSGAWKERNKERMLARQADYKKTAGKSISNASNEK